MISTPEFTRRLRIVTPIAIVSFVLGLSFGCLSDPADVEPPDDDEDAGVEEDVDDGEEDVGEGADACEPVSCEDEELAGQCGEIDDECGGTIDCGCGDYEDCDADGQCICFPDLDALCDEGEYECGIVDGENTDQCGNTWEDLDCGECVHENSDCDDNVCECEANECEDDSCGMIDDGCGGQKDCGECTGDEVCNDNICEDEADECLTDSDCEHDQCGEISNKCGGTIECGDCPGGEICEEDINECCEPWDDGEFCDEMGVTCGTAQGFDNCGQLREVEDCCGEGFACQESGVTETCIDMI